MQIRVAYYPTDLRLDLRRGIWVDTVEIDHIVYCIIVSEYGNILSIPISDVSVDSKERLRISDGIFKE